MKKGDELVKLVYLTNDIPVMTIMIQFSGAGSDVWHLHSGFIEKKKSCCIGTSALINRLYVQIVLLKLSFTRFHKSLETFLTYWSKIQWISRSVHTIRKINNLDRA